MSEHAVQQWDRDVKEEPAKLDHVHLNLQPRKNLLYCCELGSMNLSAPPSAVMVRFFCLSLVLFIVVTP